MTPDMNNNKAIFTPENKLPIPGMSSFVMSPKSPEYDPDAVLSDANSQRITTPANEYHSASEAFTPTLIMNPDRNNNNMFSPISTDHISSLDSQSRKFQLQIAPSQTTNFTAHQEAQIHATARRKQQEERAALEADKKWLKYLCGNCYKDIRFEFHEGRAFKPRCSECGSHIVFKKAVNRKPNRTFDCR